ESSSRSFPPAAPGVGNWARAGDVAGAEMGVIECWHPPSLHLRVAAHLVGPAVLSQHDSVRGLELDEECLVEHVYALDAEQIQVKRSKRCGIGMRKHIDRRAVFRQP